jgi:hypothetical protein
MQVSAEVLLDYLRLDLYAAGWKDSIHPDSSFEQRAMSALHNSLLKKFHNEQVHRDRDDAALALFLQCNQSCENYRSIVPRRLDEEYVIGEMKSIIYDFFFPRYLTGSKGEEYPYREPLLLNETDITANLALGNGSNIGTSADFYSKYVTSSMSHTNEYLPLSFKRALCDAGLWGDVEAFRSRSFGFQKVAGSRLSYVPKSWKISRTICTEPLLNMFYQQGIRTLLEGRIRQVFGIDFSDQPDRNVRLARQGSITGDFGTIDLSSASDSISLNLCRELIPREPLSWLMRCRSPVTTLPGGETIELHMISSMGNGYTFPLQTMIFSALVKAVYKLHGIPIMKPYKRSDGNFAVFGDDIIVRREVYDLTCRCLEILGFTVNLEKSFNEGHFRESCGSDFYLGRNLRGVYLKRLLNAGDFYTAINRLNRWSASHGIFLPRTVGYLRTGCRFIGVPFDESDDSGIKVPLAALRVVRRDSNGATRYLALCRVPLTQRIPSLSHSESFDDARVAKIGKNLPGFVYNGDGIMLCFVAGWLRNGKISLRSNAYRAVLRKRVTPGWDNVYCPGVERHLYYNSWKAAVVSNLSLELVG